MSSLIDSYDYTLTGSRSDHVEIRNFRDLFPQVYSPRKKFLKK